MKYVLVLCIMSILTSCDDSLLNKEDNEKFKNSKYERLLLSKWKLISINCYLAEKKDYKEYHYGNISPNDSLYRNFYLSFSKGGNLIYNDTMNIAKWSLEESNLTLNGRNQSDIFLDLKSKYIIKSIGSKFLRIYKYYFDSNGVVNFRIDYQFINTARLTEKEDLFKI